MLWIDRLEGLLAEAGIQILDTTNTVIQLHYRGMEASLNTDNINRKIKERPIDQEQLLQEIVTHIVASFENKRTIAFAGIGNPENFFDLLKEHKINTIEKISYPDHYDYSNKELENLINRSKNNNAILLTTEKDYLRISSFNRRGFGVIPIKVNINDEERFIQMIKKFIK